MSMEKVDLEIVETELPEGWEMVEIGSVLDVITNGNTPKAEYMTQNYGEVPFIKVQNLRYDGRLDFDKHKSFISSKTHQELLGRSICLPDDVLINIVGPPLGKVSVVPSDYPEWNINQAIVLFRPNSKVASKYLSIILQSPQTIRWLTDTARATAGQWNVKLSVCRKLPIPLPPLAEQKRIVAQIETLFSDLEASKARILTAQEQLKTYRQSVLKWAFEGRFTREDVVEGELPEGWETTLIESIGDVQLGRQRSPSNVSHLFPRKYIRAANITENGLDLGDILEMEFSPKEFPRFKLQYGDIVLSEASGSASQVGKPAIWKNEIEDCCFQNTVIRLRLYEMQFANYVLWLLKFLYKSGFFAKVAGGVGINHLSAGKFSKIEIPLPPLEEQHRIVQEIESRLGQCDALEAALQAALQQAEALRQSILKQAFEGKL